MAALWVWEYRVLLMSGRWSAWKPDPGCAHNLSKADALDNLPRDEDATEFRLSKYVREWTA